MLTNPHKGKPRPGPRTSRRHCRAKAHVCLSRALGELRWAGHLICLLGRQGMSLALSGPCSDVRFLLTQRLCDVQLCGVVPLGHRRPVLPASVRTLFISKSQGPGVPERAPMGPSTHPRDPPMNLGSGRAVCRAIWQWLSFVPQVTSVMGTWTMVATHPGPGPGRQQVSAASPGDPGQGPCWGAAWHHGGSAGTSLASQSDRWLPCGEHLRSILSLSLLMPVDLYKVLIQVCGQACKNMLYTHMPMHTCIYVP